MYFCRFKDFKENSTESTVISTFPNLFLKIESKLSYLSCRILNNQYAFRHVHRSFYSSKQDSILTKFSHRIQLLSQFLSCERLTQFYSLYEISLFWILYVFKKKCEKREKNSLQNVILHLFYINRGFNSPKVCSVNYHKKASLHSPHTSYSIFGQLPCWPRLLLLCLINVL